MPDVEVTRTGREAALRIGPLALAQCPFFSFGSVFGHRL